MLSRQIQMSSMEFVELKDIIYKNSGIIFTENKKYFLENRLSKRIQELNFNSFQEYIYYLKYDIRKRIELDTMINLVTINETYFLRERGQLDYLINVIAPEFITAGKRSLRVWSVPCSTGEEPYSLAVLLQNSGIYNKLNVTIIATDINTEVVAYAKKGEYHNSSFRSVPPDFYKNFNQDDQSYFIKDEIKQKVMFNVGNLLSPSMSAIIGKVDVIFCRNLLIYFDMEGKKKVMQTFYKTLNNPGYLFLGHSETMNKVSDDFTMKNFGTGIVYMKK